MLFVLMAGLAVMAVAIARYIEISWIGRGLRAIRDSEEAAEASGVPTLKLKVFACTVSGALMGVAGAPMPMYLSFIEPASTFNLNYAIGALASPMIGGTAHFLGPVIGAILLSSLQQLVTVTISNEVNVLVVGVMLVVFVVAAPDGILGLLRKIRWETLLSVRDVSKHFGGFTALSGVSLEIGRGERFGLIGPNGSGKTTLINCISGALRNDGGSIAFQGEEISALPAYQRTRRGIARSFQIPRPFTSMSVLENLVVPLEYVQHRGSLHTADTRREALEILQWMGLADKAETPSNRLTQVELRKLELARAMAARPQLLISDESMAGLSGNEVEEVLAILRTLNESGITIIMIEHIMQAVMRFSQRVVCLDAGRIICEGTPAQIVQNPEVQRAYLGA
jgi:branched-chain amino acid transport system ATP-binding protein